MTEDLILASGLSLTRNDALAPFPHLADDDSLRAIAERVQSAVSRAGTPGEWLITPLEELGPSTRAYLVERGLMTPSFAQPGGRQRAFMLYRSGEASIEVNGEDHVLVLGSRTGENLSALWGTLSGVDDVIETEVSYAFDDRYGYLAARPDLAGTGVKAYVTLHLPALMVTGRLGSLAVQLLGQGLTLTPLWGGAGGLFQVSNKGGQGIGEVPITEAVRAASSQVAQKERAVRKKLLRENPARVRDYIGRALGVAQQAWMVGVEEALGLISAIQSGVEMRVVEAPAINPQAAFRLMQRVQPGHLAVEQGSGIPGVTDDDQLDQVRARILRESFAQARVRDWRR